jgi:hypothetical protein
MTRPDPVPRKYIGFFRLVDACDRPGCPVCDDHPQFHYAYDRSQGLCVPHALQALDLGAGTEEARQLVKRTLPKWAELRRDLQGFIGKHDYRMRQPFTEAEGIAYLRALEVLVGVPGLFANDLGAGHRDRGSRERPIDSRPPIATTPGGERGE